MDRPAIKRSRALVIGAAVCLSGLIAAWLSGLTRSPARCVPSDASGSAPRAVRLRPLPIDHPLDLPLGLRDEAAPRSPAPVVKPGLEADVRPDPPPEAFLAVQPHARSLEGDTGLVFRDEPSGDLAGEEGKDLRPLAAQAPPDGPVRPGASADVRPPPDPAAWLPEPPRTGPDPDTGLVFSGPAAAGPSDDKR